ncbi:MAG: D,D-dipeptide ABC transporter permease, partial [Pseudomonadota bacterium]
MISNIGVRTEQAGLRAWLNAPIARSPAQARAQSAWKGWRRLQSNHTAFAGFLIVLALAIVAVFAPYLATQSPFEQDLAARLEPPSMAHWFGTDDLGR